MLPLHRIIACDPCFDQAITLPAARTVVDHPWSSLPPLIAATETDLSPVVYATGSYADILIMPS